MATSETPCVAALIIQDSEGGRIVAKYYEPTLFGDKAHVIEFEKKLFKKMHALITAAGGASTTSSAGAATNGTNSTTGQGSSAPSAASRSSEQADILLLDGLNIVYRFGLDVTFCVIGGGDENELFLVMVLEALFESLSLLLKGQLEKRELLSHLELVLLTIDELVDGGVPFELDAQSIESRVMLRGAVPDSLSSYSEMTLGKLADKARDKLAKQFANA